MRARPPTPSAAAYADALGRLAPLARTHLDMLRFQHSAPSRTVTPEQMARAVGYSHYGVANLQFGRLGRRVGDLLSFHPTLMPVDVLVTQSKPSSLWVWTMRPRVADALERLAWVDPRDFTSPDELVTGEAVSIASMVEGASLRVTVNGYERNPKARKECLVAHGASCAICEFNFGRAYGEVAEGYIHVHHLRPLSQVGHEHAVDPVKDLRPVCANCHGVLHLRDPPFSIEEVRAFLGGGVVRAVKGAAGTGAEGREADPNT